MTNSVMPMTSVKSRLPSQSYRFFSAVYYRSTKVYSYIISICTQNQSVRSPYENLDYRNNATKWCSISFQYLKNEIIDHPLSKSRR